MPGATLDQTANGKCKSYDKPFFTKRFYGVFGTGRVKPAAAPEMWSERSLIGANQQDKDAGHWTIEWRVGDEGWKPEYGLVYPQCRTSRKWGGG